MALETIVFPQELLSYGFKDLYSLGGIGDWSYNFDHQQEDVEQVGKDFFNTWNSSPSLLLQPINSQDTNSPPSDNTDHLYYTDDFASSKEVPSPSTTATATATTARRKRRRTKNSKNKEEVENQRMTHIAVERNRRKQMNEYLAMLRSLMPASYAQRGDQASIIGGAINFVKELEQLLQSLEAQKRIKQEPNADFSTPFSDFFTFPQYSSCSGQSTTTTNDSIAKNRSGIADIQVNMVESHANLKVLTPRRPKQLLKMVAGFQTLRLTILHLNVTTVDDMVLYSLNVKVEEECQLSSVDDIATAVYQMLGRIQQEISLS